MTQSSKQTAGSGNYPIGIAGQKWSQAHRSEWLAAQSIKRSYQQEVIDKLSKLADKLDISRYGALSYDSDRYPLYVVQSPNWYVENRTALITGGVHGYETSGVQGAVRFLEEEIHNYRDHFNIIVAPCISPWAYETINRWNPDARDPNRSFIPNSHVEESSLLMQCVRSIAEDIFVHIDLHETTDSDNSEFRPALSARDNVEHAIWDIPDGFYLVGDTENPNTEFQSQIIKAVEKVTHIAEADNDGKLIGENLQQFGVINYATKSLGLCTGFSDCVYGTTTEVYPDSPRVDDEICIQAQVAVITSALDYLKDHGGK